MQLNSTEERIAAIKTRLLSGERPQKISKDIRCSGRLVGAVRERIDLEGVMK